MNIFVIFLLQITDKDIVSQKVCQKCCQVTIKMFEFRKTSLKNDQLLKVSTEIVVLSNVNIYYI